MQDFSVEGVNQLFGGSEQNFRISRSRKFGVISPKISLQLSKNMKNYWETSEKVQFLGNFSFYAGGWRKIIIIYRGYNGGWGLNTGEIFKFLEK